jgi:hypothetical protein
MRQETRMETALPLIISITTVLGIVAIGLGTFVMGSPMEVRQHRRTR